MAWRAGPALIGEDRRMRHIAVPVVGVALLLGTAGCGGGGGNAARTSTTGSTEAGGTTTTAAHGGGTTTTAAATTTSLGARTTTTTSTCGPSAGGTDSVTRPMPSGIMLLTDVVAKAEGACADKVALTFRSDTSEEPGFTLGYRDPPFSAAASGAPIEVEGSAFLVLRLEPAALVDMSIDTAPLTYTGPQDILPARTVHVREMTVFDSYEGVLGWIIGLDEKVPFAVTTSSAPPSLVITIG